MRNRKIIIEWLLNYFQNHTKPYNFATFDFTCMF